MKNTKFNKERMKFYATQIADYCDSLDSCKDCPFRDAENLRCGLSGSNDKEKAPYKLWDFE